MPHPNLSSVSRLLCLVASTGNMAIDGLYGVTILLLAPGILSYPLGPTNKVSLATWGTYFQQDHMGPGTYAFGYDIEDPITGNIQFKQEERHPNGTITGNYGYVAPDGKPYVVTYVSDDRGYRAKIEIEGEPVQYFPDVSSFWGNSLQDMQIQKRPTYSRSAPIYNQIDTFDQIYPPLPGPLVVDPVSLPDSPYYFKYARIIAK